MGQLPTLAASADKLEELLLRQVSVSWIGHGKLPFTFVNLSSHSSFANATPINLDPFSIARFKTRILSEHNRKARFIGSACDISHAATARQKIPEPNGGNLADPDIDHESRIHARRRIEQGDPN
ncbi:hypothetical protein FHT86_007015 [Rhizobium sp. BK313]|uniref:hypothetical protein n=1 Tax=Rhizobium sp. BK313 TaxID=2587081 RepID=UPI00105ECF30|nr:hypothetical protein [Rhizobium sp. BK313]MBB3458689.1 hypothetical protein [Rhizobium sp. BK313]